MKRVVAKYNITYRNGITQDKNLITSEDYHNIIKPIQSIIGILEPDKKMSSHISSLKKIQKEMFGSEYFTDNSPLFDAIKTGKLVLPDHQGGTTQCKLVKIK